MAGDAADHDVDGVAHRSDGATGADREEEPQVIVQR